MTADPLIHPRVPRQFSAGAYAAKDASTSLGNNASRMRSGWSSTVSGVRVRLSDLVIQVGTAKESEHAERESGEAVQLTERQTGNFSVVHADCQGHGRPAKTMANPVARKAVGLIAAGARDGATAHADGDFLIADRHGQVPTDFNIISLDL